MMELKQKRRRAYFQEEDLTEVLKVLNRHIYNRADMKLIVGNCEELDEPKVWYVHFYCNDKQWDFIWPELNKIKPMTIIDLPVGV